jgi:hypothetical protein
MDKSKKLDVFLTFYLESIFIEVLDELRRKKNPSVWRKFGEFGVLLFKRPREKIPSDSPHVFFGKIYDMIGWFGVSDILLWLFVKSQVPWSHPHTNIRRSLIWHIFTNFRTIMFVNQIDFWEIWLDKTWKKLI